MVRPRFASTVILVRPDENGEYDILLTRRPAEMRFLGGYYVFPGGTVHRDDYSTEILARCRRLSGDEASAMLDSSHETAKALGHWVAVFRELFEEVGVLLCVNDQGQPIALPGKAERERIELARRKIVRRTLSFGGFLVSENLFCDLSRAKYFDHWVTPEIYSMRFDTRFYIARLPEHQTALARSEEVTHSLWIKAEEALARRNHRDFPSCRRRPLFCSGLQDWRTGTGCRQNSNWCDWLNSPSDRVTRR